MSTVHRQSHRETLAAENAAMGNLYFTVYGEPDWGSWTYDADNSFSAQYSEYSDGYTARLSSSTIADLSSLTAQFSMCVQKSTGLGAMCSTMTITAGVTAEPVLAWYPTVDFYEVDLNVGALNTA